MLELLIIFMLCMLNIYILSYYDETTLKSYYSLYETQWTQRTIQSLIFALSGFTIFRALTLDSSPSRRYFINMLQAFLLYEILWCIIFLVSQIDFFFMLDNIHRVVGYQTYLKKPESMFIHYTRCSLTTLGYLTTIYIIMYITSTTAFMIQVDIMVQDGNLGAVTLLN